MKAGEGETMRRRVEPEWLDELPAEDERAVGSRQDLRRVNAWMGHANRLSRVLRAWGGNPRRLVDLGAGDGTFLLAVARRLVARWPRLEIILVDRQNLVRRQTQEAFANLGWTVRSTPVDVFDWLQGKDAADIMLANLFLHHFPADRLKFLLSLAASKTELFAACEPRRGGLPLLFSRLIGLIGCNSVTRHDAVVSVRAGFQGRELSALWPQESRWRLEERAMGPFSHLFVARR
jgi:hypothetical protein